MSTSSTGVVRQAGFTLVECLVACAITAVLAASLLSVVALHATIARTHPERLDAQQRARAAASALYRDVSAAGAGVDSGPRTGPLLHYLPPILPRRSGLLLADEATIARPDTITVTRVASSLSQSTLAAPVVPAAPSLLLTPYATCPPPAGLCGLGAGAVVLAYAEGGAHSWFRLSGTMAPAPLQPLQAGFSGRATGDIVAEAERHTYYLDASTRQLRHYDGVQTDVPVVDDVVGLRFEYFGEAVSPRRPKPPMGEANCLYDAAGTLLPLHTLPSSSPLVALPLERLSDGPWCGGADDRFDADLLRIRMVRVSIRVQASPPWARASGPQFQVPGTARTALASVADVQIVFDVVPRNMAIGLEGPE